MSKPRLLDLFCGAGGAAKGYQRAGFYVIGVDIKPQPNYCGEEFYEADALAILRGERVSGRAEHAARLGRFDAIHASPPCQAFTAYRRRGGGVGDGYPDDIRPLRTLLDETGLPYVIENVQGAPLIDPVMLCGTGFGLDVQRHRFFEARFPIMSPGCAHGRHAPRFAQATNRATKRKTVEVGVWRISLEIQRRAMGIDWMTLPELSEAIPPAYTEHIGGYLMRELEASRIPAADSD